LPKHLSFYPNIFWNILILPLSNSNIFYHFLYCRFITFPINCTPLKNYFDMLILPKHFFKIEIFGFSWDFWIFLSLHFLITRFWKPYKSLLLHVYCVTIYWYVHLLLPHTIWAFHMWISCKKLVSLVWENPTRKNWYVTCNSSNFTIAKHVIIQGSKTNAVRSPKAEIVYRQYKTSLNKHFYRVYVEATLISSASYFYRRI
jgi:hypothetical protein